MHRGINIWARMMSADSTGEAPVILFHMSSSFDDLYFNFTSFFLFFLFAREDNFQSIWGKGRGGKAQLRSPFRCGTE